MRRLIPDWLQGPWGLLGQAGLLYAAVFTGWVLLSGPGLQKATLALDLGLLPAGFLAVLAGARTAFSPRLEPRLRWAWTWLTLGVLSQLIADLIYAYLEHVAQLRPAQMASSPADVSYLLFYPLALAGLVFFPTAPRSPSERFKALIDSATVLITAWMVVSHFLLEPAAANTDPVGLAVIAAYPLGDLVLLGGVAALLLRRPEPATRGALRLFLAGLAVFTLADLLFAVVELRETYAANRWIDAGWAAAYALFALAPLRQLAAPGPQTERPASRLMGRVGHILPYLAVLLAYGLAIWSAAVEAELHPDLLAGAISVTLLVLGRQALALRENADLNLSLDARTRELRALSEELEQRVLDRTAELKHATQAMERINAELQAESLNAEYRARQLGLSAEVANAAASLQKADELLALAAQLIHQRFDYYHVGLYLLDESGQWIVLCAAGGAAGAALLEKGLRLPADALTVVGYAALTGRPRLARREGPEATYFRQAELDQAQSQIAVPLRVRSAVIGALNVQSRDVGGLSQPDMPIIQTLADQLGVAVDNARLFESLEKSRAEVRELQQQAHSGLTLAESTGYEYDGLQVRPLAAGAPGPRGDLRLPLTLGGSVLGEVDLQRPGRPWSDEDRELAAIITERMTLALENARLFETTRASLAETARLYQASRDIAAGRSLDEIARALLQHGAAPHYTRLAVGLAETDDWQTVTSLQLVADWAPETGLRESASLTRADLPALAQLLPGTPLILEAAQADLQPDMQAVMQAQGWRSLLLLPFGAGARLTGSLLIAVGRPHRFGEDELRSLQSLADQAAVAIENIRLLDETRRRVGELATLNSIGQVLTSGSGDLDSLLVQTGEKIVQAFGVTDGYIALYDANTHLIRIPFFVEQGERMLLDPVPLGEGLASVILRTRQHLLLNRDAMRQAEALGARLVGRPTLSFLGVPILAGDEAIGVINVQSAEREGLFAESDVGLLTTIAANVSAAIQNARLLNETRRRAQQLATAAEVSRAAISQLNQDELIRNTVELIRDRFGLYYAAVFLADAGGEWAVLKHATGEAGQTLLARGHRLQIGGQSMVGAAIGQRLARIALDVGAEPARFANPLLPETRSEMALPLAVGPVVLGALDVQSTQPGAFSQADVTVLQTMADQLATAVQNARLFAETQRRVAELGLLNRIGQALTSQLDLRAQINAVGELLLDYFQTPNGYIALYNRATNLIEIPFFKEGNQRQSVDPFPLGEGVSSAIIRSRAPLLINENAEQRLRELGARIVGKPALSFLGVPIIVGAEVIGVINVQSSEREGLFGQNDVDLLSTIAATVGSAIQTARLFAETGQRAQQLATAAEVARAATSTLNVEEVLRQAVELIRDRFGLYHVGIYIIEPGTETAHLRAAAGEAGRALVAREHQHEVGSKSLVGAAAFTRQAVVVQDIARDEAHYRHPLLPGSRAQAVMPLLSGDLVVGALDAHSPVPGAFGDTDLTVLRTIADQLAAAVQNARLFESARRLAGREQTLNQIAGKLRGLLEISSIAQTAVEELGRALGARRTILRLGTQDQLLPTPPRPAGGNGRESGSNGAAPADPETMP